MDISSCDSVFSEVMNFELKIIVLVDFNWWQKQERHYIYNNNNGKNCPGQDNSVCVFACVCVQACIFECMFKGGDTIIWFHFA